MHQVQKIAGILIHQAVADLLALALPLDDARVLQLGKMGRYAGLGDPQVLLNGRDVAGLLH